LSEEPKPSDEGASWYVPKPDSQLDYYKNLLHYYHSGETPDGRKLNQKALGPLTHDQWLEVSGPWCSYFMLKPPTRISRFMRTHHMESLYFWCCNRRNWVIGKYRKLRRKREKHKGIERHYTTFDEWIDKEIM
jgi:hypothetical protein